MTERKKPDTKELLVPEAFDPPIKPKEYLRIQKALRWLADQLGLTDWTFRLHSTPEPDDTAFATIHVVENRRYANIRLCKEWKTLTVEEQLTTLVHELMHCHFDPMQHYTEQVLERAVGDVGMAAFEPAMDQHVETSVDNISVAVGRLIDRDKFAKLIGRKVT